MALPIAAGTTTFTPPYANVAATNAPFVTGSSAVNLNGALPPAKITGELVYWHNSSVGQAGPAKAEDTIAEGFGTVGIVVARGIHSITLTWTFNGEGTIGLTCYGSSGGTGEASITERAEVNLYNTATNAWLLPTNSVSQIWTHSITTCNSYSYYTLTGTTVATFSSISVPATATFQIWGYLSTNTTALESSASDLYANACIDYSLNATSCYGNTGGLGNATLSSIAFT
jgi:hypothetical protein